MRDVVKNYFSVLENIRLAFEENDQKPHAVAVICVSKGKSANEILPLLEAGVRKFGENRMEETEEKWPLLLKRFPDTELHFIGGLQSRKIQQISDQFDVVHSLSTLSHAKIFQNRLHESKKNPHLYVQVNMANEPQKNGVSVDGAVDFIQICQSVYQLNIKGVMCIPPVSELAAYHFCRLKQIARQAGGIKTSMGMTADYREAALCGADFLRIGSLIFS